MDQSEPNNSKNKDEKPLVESMRVLEALLFASDDILSAEKLKSIIPGAPDARAIRKMVEAINVQLQNQRHPFEIVEIGGGYRFRTVSFYYQWIQRLFKEKAAKKLSIQSLECLAIIAYKQPITKAEIEAIRGVLSDGAMKTLLERHLVTISGRSEKAGRPLLYATTQEFLTYFGLNKLADLPRIDEFEALAKEKLGELSEAELKHIETEKKADEQLASNPDEL
jgi:segregation and condensation protein B